MHALNHVPGRASLEACTSPSRTGSPRAGGLRQFLLCFRSNVAQTLRRRATIIDSGRDQVKLLIRVLWRLQVWRDVHGQDLIEYALLAGFVALAAGALMPGVAGSISTVFSRVGWVMGLAAAQPKHDSD